MRLQASARPQLPTLLTLLNGKEKKFRNAFENNAEEGNRDKVTTEYSILRSLSN